MSDTIFDTNPDQGTAPVVPPAASPTTQLSPELEAIVGTGKKYATVEAAMAALPHTQTHISKLESELAELREDLNKRQTTQELLDALKSNGTNVQGVTAPKEISQDDIVKLVEQVVSQKEVKRTSESNISSVIGRFKEVFGADKAKDQFLKLSQETGVSVTELNRLAALSPAVIYKLAGLDNKAPTIPGKVTSTVNTQTSQVEGVISAAVKGTSTKDLLDAWHRAGEKVKQLG